MSAVRLARQRSDFLIMRGALPEALTAGITYIQK